MVEPQEPAEVREELAELSLLVRKHAEVAERHPDDASLAVSLEFYQQRAQQLRAAMVDDLVVRASCAW